MVNLFVFHKIPEKAVRDYPDVYTYNGIRELGQLMQGALVLNGVPVDRIPNDGVSHKKHPVSRWAGRTRENWVWAYRWLEAMHNEYRRRYGENKSHRSYQKINRLDEALLRQIPSGELEEPPQCMPDEYKHENVVHAYRRYFANEKATQDWCVWERGERPEWVQTLQLS